MTEETVHDFISDIKEMLKLSEKDVSKLYPKREDDGRFDSLKKSGWKRVRDRIRQMDKRIRVLEKRVEASQDAENEFLIRKGYVWPYGVCHSELCVDTFSFSSDIEGNPEVEKYCPECGFELEIRYKLKLSEDVENLPPEIRERVEEDL